MALVDPNPLVAGQGIERMRAAASTSRSACWRQPARELNIGFFSRMIRGLPWIRMKAAASLDGRTALANGASQWITGAEARADGHAWRKRAAAIVTGVGTVRDDDPRLDVRLVPTAMQPLRVIIDSHLQTPLDSRILAEPGKVLVYGAQSHGHRQQALQRRGIEVMIKANAAGKVDLAAAMSDLAARASTRFISKRAASSTARWCARTWSIEYLVYLAPEDAGPGP